MLLGTKGTEILKWRASQELLAGLEDTLASKWEHSPTGEAHDFLEQYIEALTEEQGYEAQLAAELEILDRGIAEAESPAQLAPLKTRYLELVASHFRRRRSVLALRGLCGELHDRLLARVTALAGARMAQLGQGKAPRFALLVAGDRGRGEQTLQGENRYFLVHEEQPERFLLFRRQFSAALQEAGLPGGDATLWHGGLKEWHRFLWVSLSQEEPQHPAEDFLAPLPPFSEAPPAEPREVPWGEWEAVTLADLTQVQGEAGLGSRALAAAARALQGERHRESFLVLARQVIGMPLALGRFGRWRLEKSGEHRGELNLKQYALAPLVLGLRVLALHAGITASQSVERIHRLLEVGALDVELAGKLLKAYQLLMQLRILIEIRGDGGECFCNPEEFSEETETRFRTSLEALQSLQKIGYQRVVGLG